MKVRLDVIENGTAANTTAIAPPGDETADCVAKALLGLHVGIAATCKKAITDVFFSTPCKCTLLEGTASRSRSVQVLQCASVECP